MGNAVTTEPAAFATQQKPKAAQRIRLISGYRNRFVAFVKNQRRERLPACRQNVS
jgi:hypothetical protein